MPATGALLAPIDLWRDTLLLCAVLLGVEAPALLWLAVRAGRSWRSWLFSLAPAAGFVYVLHAARALADLSAWWHAYLFFQAAHYGPSYLPAFNAANDRELQPVVAGVSTLGWECGAATALLLTFGWALLIRWTPRSHPFHEPALAAASREEDTGALEITVEPLEPA